YRVWLSEVMLQQTVIKAVLPAYARFLAALPTVAHLGAASEEQVRLLVRWLGYYRRFSHMHKAVQELTDYGRAADIVWPKDVKSWRNLPGIGAYTGAALASIVSQQPVAVVDGNVERVLARLWNIQLPGNLPALKPTFARLAQELIKDRPGD